MGSARLCILLPPSCSLRRSARCELSEQAMCQRSRLPRAADSTTNQMAATCDSRCETEDFTGADVIFGVGATPQFPKRDRRRPLVDPVHLWERAVAAPIVPAGRDGTALALLNSRRWFGARSDGLTRHRIAMTHTRDWSTPAILAIPWIAIVLATGCATRSRLVEENMRVETQIERPRVIEAATMPSLVRDDDGRMPREIIHAVGDVRFAPGSTLLLPPSRERLDQPADWGERGQAGRHYQTARQGPPPWVGTCDSGPGLSPQKHARHGEPVRGPSDLHRSPRGPAGTATPRYGRTRPGV